MDYPKDIILIRPDYYDLEYSINKHMDLSQKIDKEKAIVQWQELKDAYLKIGLNVIELPAHQGHPDMVFCANTIFSLPKSGNYIYSKMRHSQRAGEVNILRKRFPGGYQVNQHFEAMGDLIIDYENDILYGGYGFRTNREVYTEIEPVIKREIVKLELINEDFYHLDTCLAPINKTTALIVKEAFQNDVFEQLKNRYKNLIEIDSDEALTYLACNAFSPNGNDVFVEKGALQLQEQLLKLNFRVKIFDTSEYLKSGGSIFCMKNLGWFS